MGDGAGGDSVITSGEEITGARKDRVVRRGVYLCASIYCSDTHVAHMWSQISAGVASPPVRSAD